MLACVEPANAADPAMSGNIKEMMSPEPSDAEKMAMQQGLVPPPMDPTMMGAPAPVQDPGLNALAGMAPAPMGPAAPGVPFYQ